MEQRNLILHLTLIHGVGASVILKLLDKNCFSNLYSFDVQHIVSLYRIKHELALKIVQGLKDKSLLEQELLLVQKHNVNWITIIDEDYPVLLKHINSPPPVLYYYGAPLNIYKKNIAIIGARKAHIYASHVLEHCVPALVNKGWVVMSGGALGVDTMAHSQALYAGGSTVAILGSGLLHMYPRSNSRLFDQIIDGGGSIVSSFSLQTKPFATNFPQRNRIISGMSKACLVVQAAQKSGALITAEYALQQGRQVFAVTGSILDPLSNGCHRLIKEGATPMIGVSDFLQELGETAVQQELPFIAKGTTEQQL